MNESPMREIRYRRVVDLSHSIKPGMPRWPGDPPVRFETVAAITEVGYFLRRFEMGEHSGTHISSPATFYADAAGPDDLQPEQLVVTVAVVDVSVRAGADPDYVLDRRDIESWEQEWGRIPQGALVLLYTGWHRYWEEPHRFINADSSGVMHTPGFAPEAARELLQARGASGLGTDAPGVDAGVDTSFEVSRLVLEKHRLVLECLNNLDQLPPAGSTIVVGRLSLVGGSGSPASVLALTP